MNSERLTAILDDFFANRRRVDYALLKVVGSNRKSSDHCLVYNVRDGGITLIEDDAFAEQLVKAMIQSGFPVFLKEELPPVRLVIDDILYEMKNESISIDLRNRVNRILHLQEGVGRRVVEEVLKTLKMSGASEGLRRRISDEFDFQAHEFELRCANDRS